MKITELLEEPGAPSRAFVAEAAGISLSMLSKIENDKAKTSLDVAEAINRALGGRINPFDYIRSEKRITNRAAQGESAPA